MTIMKQCLYALTMKVVTANVPRCDDYMTIEIDFCYSFIWIKWVDYFDSVNSGVASDLTNQIRKC